MASQEDQILVLYVSDGQDWANFLSNRLATPQYGIVSQLRDLSEPIPPPPPPPRKSTSSTSSSSSSPSSSSSSTPRNSSQSTNRKAQTTDPVEEDNVYMNHSTETGSDPNNNNNNNNNRSRESGRRTSQKTLDRSSSSSCSNSLEESFSRYRAVVVFLSPGIVEGDCPFPIDVTALEPKTCVFLLLGVEIEEARTFFGEHKEHAFKSRISVIDGSEKTICDAMVQIIEAYEESQHGDDGDWSREDIYNIPPSPVQVNKVEKIFPNKLIDGDRDVYVLLARPTEEDALVVIDDAMSMELTLTPVCDRLYSFTLPKHLKGVISFQIESSGHSLGEGSVTVVTPLDNIREILSREVMPLALLATALGLSPDDVTDVDTTLAFKLQELASTVTFAKMFPCEDGLAQNPLDERSNLMWPSLLHFAADLNLRTLCSELLKYPGMLASAVTENKEGLYPSQMAAKKGYTQIEQDLVKFVESHRSECYDSDSSDYILPVPMAPSLQPKQKPPVLAPKPQKTNQGHSKATPSANTDLDPASQQIYIDMGSVPARPALFELQHQHSDSSMGGLSPHSRDSVFGSVSSKEEGDMDELYMNMDDVSLGPSRESTLTRHSSDVSSPVQSPTDPKVTDSPTSRKALKMLGVREDDIQRSRTSTLDPTVCHVEPSSMLPYLAATPPSVTLPRYNLLSDQRLSVSSNCENPADFLLDGSEHKKEPMRDKMKSFFNKIKGSKRTGSDGDIQSYTLKKNSSGRMSTGSNKSESKLGSSSKGNKPLVCSPEAQERDSGSYSDEEKDKGSTSVRRNKQKVFRESDKPMSRRISRRAQQAKKEKIDNAPTLPPNQRRATFRSFIQDESGDISK